MRHDHQHIASLIHPKANVLEIGCGNGELLLHLTENMDCNAGYRNLHRKCTKVFIAGLISDARQCGEHLNYYSDNAFDYVILAILFRH